MATLDTAPTDDVRARSIDSDEAREQDFLAEIAALVRRELRRVIRDRALIEPYRPIQHEVGDLIDVSVTGVSTRARARATFELERFVGGGFAGQVYRTRLIHLRDDEGVNGLVEGQRYAVKILRPPSSSSLAFRNLMFRLGYQAPFALQLNADTARAGALWQKMIRRAAAVRFGTDRHVADVYATFFDADLCSHGEIGEWIDGRTWRLEPDAHVFQRRHRPACAAAPGDASFEFLEKKCFMREFVALLHDTGAHELARQYEWRTWKSQPNVLKRTGGEAELTAIDFRPGLALIAGLPMSPGDVGLIVRGLARGKLAQFDDGDIVALRAFAGAHPESFSDLDGALDELAAAHARSRELLPDLLNRPLRLVTKLSSAPVRSGAAEAWLNRGWIDQAFAGRLSQSPLMFLLLWVVAWVPVLGRLVIQLTGSRRFRRHASACFKPAYLSKVLAASRAATLIRWHRKGRISDENALLRVHQPAQFLVERVCLGWLPAALHRAVIDWPYTRQKLRVALQFPVRFYRSAMFRETWLRGEILAASMKGILTRDEARALDRDIADPAMRRYLKCLAIQICTAPTTTIVSLTLATYVFVRFGTTWAHSFALAAAVMASFAVLPVTPGSLVRGCWITALMIREGRYREYRLIAFLSFWQYIGFLSVPLQLVFRFPALSILLLTQLARKAANRLPVFGESGALFEHKVFDLVFNMPVSILMRLRRRPAA